MKQVVFAIALLAMASLTGCLNTEDSPVDENIDTTDDSTSDTTENNTDTTDDTKDDELIEPVGTDGDTIPADSSIHIDSPYHSQQYRTEEPPKSPVLGVWECAGENEDRECEFVYHGNDYFDADELIYYDADGITNSFGFNGWVNKTDQTVTIEAMYFPYRDSYIRSGGYSECWSEDCSDWTQINERYLGSPVGNYCTVNSCEITFYSYNGLTFNGIIKLSQAEYHEYWSDSDEDGTNDTLHMKSTYEHSTVTFDLPFEPYGFSLKYMYTDYYERTYETIDRVF